MTATINEIEANTRAALITKSEYARIFGISRAAATRQAREGRLACVKIGGRELVKTSPIRVALGLPEISSAAQATA